ncbi:hypothetical protein MYX78_10970 [Acidobacteria bacterium AH-259-G07]|nr:hypothetical protein [Acidobacteria bacterium AH-259-G07]
MLRIHDAYIIVNRMYLLPQLLHAQRHLEDWVIRLLNEYTPTKWSRRLHNEYFIPGFGPVLEPPIYDSDARIYILDELTIPETNLDYSFLEIPSNWQIRLPRTDEYKVHFNLRSHLFPLGALNIILSCHFHSKEGKNVKDFIRFLTKITSDRKGKRRQSLKLQVDKVGFSGAPSQLIDRAFDVFRNALFKNPRKSISLARKHSPDHLLIDIFKTTPHLKHEKHEREVLGILRLNPNYERLRVPRAEQDLGLYEEDWFLMNNRCFLLSQNMANWPREGKLKKSVRRRRGLSWNFFKVVEFVQFEKLWLSYLHSRLQDLSLKMRRADNKSGEFLKNLFKANYFDDSLVTLAYYLPSMHENIYGGLGKLYSVLSQKAKIDKGRNLFYDTRQNFLEQLDSWKPGVKKLLDVLPLSN